MTYLPDTDEVFDLNVSVTRSPEACMQIVPPERARSDE